MAGRLRMLKFLGFLTIAASCFTPTAQRMVNAPRQVDVAVGDTVELPFAATAIKPASSNVSVAEATMNHSSSWLVKSQHLGQANISSKIFGLIPWRTHVRVLPSSKVLVGGQAVGIRLQSKAPVVVGYRPLANGSSPSAEAHVQIGDMIVAVNRHAIHSANDLKRELIQTKDHLRLTVQHGKRKREVDISTTSNRPELGLYVRDRTVGVGTLTFYDPAHHFFGALGHVITDADTGQPVVGSGNLYNALITGLKPGTAGTPGEKRGTFSTDASTLGSIIENTPYGVFGKIERSPTQLGPFRQAMQVAFPEQVHEGDAKMYTVLHGQTVEAFDVHIDNVAHQNSPSTKSMIIRVTDPRLLAQTGGIIQGMSGSPIVQGGRLVGAVTHVFVSDPTRGYAVYAMWMLHETHDESLPTEEVSLPHSQLAV